ncbi:hypothetical protein [Desulfotignum balticum]|uniref:hypothetical protein n=1 Tax=Desulfotignum balticum TaxID=115781 RepID=UPI000462DB49|nr:hypothetical protein [Desulfotignum balticum]
MHTAITPQTFCGRNFSTEDLLMIKEVVTTCGSTSRYELAHTICELLEWKRPGGGLKARECKDLLEILEKKRFWNFRRKEKPVILVLRSSKKRHKKRCLTAEVPVPEA